MHKCPDAVTYVKPLVQEGSCHYVLSGSLLGVELKNIRSVPVGFMDEAKSGKHYQRHRALNFAMAQSDYRIREAIVFTKSRLTHRLLSPDARRCIR